MGKGVPWSGDDKERLEEMLEARFTFKECSMWFQDSDHFQDRSEQACRSAQQRFFFTGHRKEKPKEIINFYKPVRPVEMSIEKECFSKDVNFCPAGYCIGSGCKEWLVHQDRKQRKKRFTPLVSVSAEACL